MKRLAVFFLVVIVVSAASAQNLVFVAIDDDAIQQMSAQNGIDWPWPRSLYAYVLEYFSAAGTSVVAFDLLLEGEGSFGPTDDQQLAYSMEALGPVVMAGISVPEGAKAPAPLLPGSGGNTQIELSGEPTHITRALSILAMNSIQTSSPLFTQAAAMIGDAWLPAEDAVIHRVRPFSVVAGMLYPNLGLAAFMTANNVTKVSVGRNAVSIGQRTLHTDYSLLVPLSFDFEYTRLSAFDVIVDGFELASNGAELSVQPQYDGAYVIVGTDFCESDRILTPIGRLPGSIVHLSLLSLMLSIR